MNQLSWCLEQLSPPGYDAALTAARVLIQNRECAALAATRQVIPAIAPAAPSLDAVAHELASLRTQVSDLTSLVRQLCHAGAKSRTPGASPRAQLRDTVDPQKGLRLEPPLPLSGNVSVAARVDANASPRTSVVESAGSPRIVSLPGSLPLPPNASPTLAAMSASPTLAAMSASPTLAAMMLTMDLASSGQSIAGGGGGQGCYDSSDAPSSQASISGHQLERGRLRGELDHERRSPAGATQDLLVGSSAAALPDIREGELDAERSTVQHLQRPTEASHRKRLRQIMPPVVLPRPALSRAPVRGKVLIQNRALPGGRIDGLVVGSFDAEESDSVSLAAAKGVALRQQRQSRVMRRVAAHGQPAIPGGVLARGVVTRRGWALVAAMEDAEVASLQQLYHCGDGGRDGGAAGEPSLSIASFSPSAAATATALHRDAPGPSEARLCDASKPAEGRAGRLGVGRAAQYVLPLATSCAAVPRRPRSLSSSRRLDSRATAGRAAPKIHRRAQSSEPPVRPAFVLQMPVGPPRPLHPFPGEQRAALLRRNPLLAPENGVAHGAEGARGRRGGLRQQPYVPPLCATDDSLRHGPLAASPRRARSAGHARRASESNPFHSQQGMFSVPGVGPEGRPVTRSGADPETGWGGESAACRVAACDLVLARSAERVPANVAVGAAAVERSFPCPVPAAKAAQVLDAAPAHLAVAFASPQSSVLCSAGGNTSLFLNGAPQDALRSNARGSHRRPLPKSNTTVVASRRVHRGEAVVQDFAKLLEFDSPRAAADFPAQGRAVRGGVAGRDVDSTATSELALSASLGDASEASLPSQQDVSKLRGRLRHNRLLVQRAKETALAAETGSSARDTASSYSSDVMPSFSDDDGGASPSRNEVVGPTTRAAGARKAATPGCVGLQAVRSPAPPVQPRKRPRQVASDEVGTTARERQVSSLHAARDGAVESESLPSVRPLQRAEPAQKDTANVARAESDIPGGQSIGPVECGGTDAAAVNPQCAASPTVVAPRDGLPPAHDAIAMAPTTVAAALWAGQSEGVPLAMLEDCDIAAAEAAAEEEAATAARVVARHRADELHQELLEDLDDADAELFQDLCVPAEPLAERAGLPVPVGSDVISSASSFTAVPHYASSPEGRAASSDILPARRNPVAQSFGASLPVNAVLASAPGESELPFPLSQAPRRTDVDSHSASDQTGPAPGLDPASRAWPSRRPGGGVVFGCPALPHPKPLAIKRAADNITGFFDDESKDEGDF